MNNRIDSLAWYRFTNGWRLVAIHGFLAALGRGAGESRMDETGDTWPRADAGIREVGS